MIGAGTAAVIGGVALIALSRRSAIGGGSAGAVLPAGGGFPCSLRGEQPPERWPLFDRSEGLYSLRMRRDFYAQTAEALRANGVPEFFLPFLIAHMGLATGWGRNVWGGNAIVSRAPNSWVQEGLGYMSLRGPEVGDDPRTPEVETDAAYQDTARPWKAFANLTESCSELLRMLAFDRYEPARKALERGEEVHWYELLGQEHFYTQPWRSHSQSYKSALSRVRREWVP